MSESEKTRKLCQGLRRFNALTLPIAGGMYQKDGMTDRFISHPSMPGGAWVEFKDRDNTCSEPQKIMIRELLRTNCFAIAARHAENGVDGTFEDETGQEIAEWQGPAGFLKTLADLVNAHYAQMRRDKP